MAKRSSKMKLPINEVLGVVAGAIAAGYVKKLVNDNLTMIPETIRPIIPIGVGVFLAGNKNVIVRGAGFGMVAKGGSDLAAAFLPGVGNIDDIFLSSPADQTILSLPSDQSILSGIEDDYMSEVDEISGENEMSGEDSEMMGYEDAEF
jgi:hypothetical protein